MIDAKDRIDEARQDGAKQPFLVGQRIRRLAETGNVRKYFHPDFFRSRRQSGNPERAVDMGNWVDIERDELIRMIGTGGFRGVLTTDAGLGKSVNLQYLTTHLQQANASKICVRIRLGDLASIEALSPAEFAERYLIGQVAEQLDSAGHQVSRPDVLAWLQRAVARSSLILLFDELDQVSAGGNAIKTLGKLLQSSIWSNCSVVIAGRPYAVDEQWDALFKNGTWQFFQLDGFTPIQQRTYLRDGQVDRYAQLPDETRGELQELLEVPRVLSYLRELSLEEFQAIHTPSDIYLKAIYHLIQRGLATDKASVFGLPAGRQAERIGDRIVIGPHQVRKALDVLAAMAWEMLWQAEPLSADEKRKRSGASPLDHPNFNRVEGRRSIEALQDAVFARLPQSHYGHDRIAFDDDFNRLTSMNETIERGLADSITNEQLLWRNRSLQEFLAAYALCRMCRADATDAQRLERWRYVPWDSNTDQFYWIWRFASEMDDREIKPTAWVAAMQPLYLPGDGSAEATRRSTEMIYRTWGRMEEHGPAVIEKFQSEFESIRNGSDRQRAKAAREFVAGFLQVPAEVPFRMGTPSEKQGIPFDKRQGIADALAAIAENPEEFLTEQLARAGYPPGKQGDSSRAWLRQQWLDVLAGGIEAYESWQHAKDETPARDWFEPEVAAFQLHKYPTLRSWYWLFDPGHGQRGEWFAPKLVDVAPTGDHPVFYVSWYDAWVFCKFAYWEGQCCRLPHEDEWEKAAKAARCIEECDWNYWWGDDDKEEHRTADEPYETGRSTCPRDYAGVPEGQGHKNWLGFVDILGNQWEWTDDEYRQCYSRNTPPDSTSRVARGGSWRLNPANVRSSVRYSSHPSYLYDVIGFRVARALL